MTAQEMHIDLDINLQKINSNATRNLLPQEKDWLLNKQVVRFLNSRTRDLSDKRRLGFEEDTKRLKDVLPLIKKETVVVEQLNSKEGRFVLPSFVYKHIRTDCIFFKKCAASEYSPSIQQETVIELVLPNINDFSVVVTNNGLTDTLFNTSSLPNGYLGANKYFTTIKAFEVKLRNKLRENFYKDIKVYFEWYGDTYKQNTYFIVGKNLTNVQVNLFQLSAGNTAPKKMIENSFPTYHSKKSIKRTARLVNEEVEMLKVHSHISKSLQESPLMSFERGYGYVYFPKNTIIRDVDYHYICKPNLIDVLLNNDLNLDTDICAEIVLETTNFIKALIKDGQFEQYMQQTLIE